jgi:hypothetical protein
MWQVTICIDIIEEFYSQTSPMPLGVPQRHHKETCSILHDAFKEYFCIGSTAELSDHTFLTYMSAILMIMARERGTLVPFFNESDDIQEMSMREWLALQKIIDN